MSGDDKKPAALKVKRRSAITVPVRFEFEIPTGIPDENKQIYCFEKAKRICELVSKQGTTVALQVRSVQ